MPGLLSNVDPDSLLEYSVVFTDRSLNHMSQAFQQVIAISRPLLNRSTMRRRLPRQCIRWVIYLYSTALQPGTLWVDMKALGFDILISAPQKGWSASPCAGLVMMGEQARQRLDDTTSTSFACDLKKWTQIMATMRTTPLCRPMP